MKNFFPIITLPRNLRIRSELALNVVLLMQGLGGKFTKEEAVVAGEAA